MKKNDLLKLGAGFLLIMILALIINMIRCSFKTPEECDQDQFCLKIYIIGDPICGDLNGQELCLDMINYVPVCRDTIAGRIENEFRHAVMSR